MKDSFVIGSDGLPHIDKDPDSTLNYTWNWTSWLAKAGGAAIAEAAVTADDGVVLVGVPSMADGYVSQKVRGGTVGVAYKVTCKITTIDVTPLIDERTIVIEVKQH